MSRIISLFLIYTYLLQFIITSFGCKSFYPPLNDEELQTNIGLKNQLLLKLKDQSQLVLQQDEYIFIDRPSDLIFGIGRKFNYLTKNDSLFNGSLYQIEIDSVTTRKKGLTSYYKYWLKDNSSIVFEESKIFKVTPDFGGMYWIALNNKNELQKFNHDEIQEIQVSKTNIISTCLAITGVGGIVGFIVLLAWGPRWN